MSSVTPHTRSRGFTLIELLVVIAIIAILAAILFPVFEKAREKANQSRCMNNQRQIVLSMLTYVQDHEEIFPSADTFWASCNLPPAVFKCSTAKKTIENAYVFNSGIANVPLGEITQEQSTFVTADGVWNNNNGSASFTTDLDERHSDKLIASFVDGHVALRPAAGLLATPAAAATVKVWVAGGNASYQLGNGTTTPANASTAVQVAAAPTDIGNKIALGVNFLMAVDKANQHWFWGVGSNGQFGRGSVTNQLIPAFSTTLTTADLVYGGGTSFSYMRDTSGNWKATGINTSGQLGIGNVTQQTSWQSTGISNINSVNNVPSIDVGQSTVLYVRTDGTVWGTGLNTSRQLGCNDAVNKTSWTQMLANATTPFTGATKVASGGNFSLILKSDGTVWGVGVNSNGQLCQGNLTTPQSFPVQIKTAAAAFLTGVKDIACGTSTAYFLKTDGTVWTCGLNSSGEMGQGNTTAIVAATAFAKQVPGLTNVTAISARFSHVAALLGDGSVYTWGLNTTGQCGRGDLVNKTSPGAMLSITGAQKVLVNSLNTVVVTN